LFALAFICPIPKGEGLSAAQRGRAQNRYILACYPTCSATSATLKEGRLRPKGQSSCIP